MGLIPNQSKVVLEDTLICQNWLTKPETLGDVAIIQILHIIEKKIKSYLLDDFELTNGTPDTNTSSINHNALRERKDKRSENILLIVKENQMISSMLQLLDASSSCKKDVSILILCALTSCKPVLSLMLNKSTLESLISHINSFKMMSKQSLDY